MTPKRTFDLDAYTTARVNLVQEGLRRFTPDERTPPEILHETMLYSLFCGGKRLRPLLCIAGAEAVGGSADAVLPTACALEMIHTFSLIHDDLPAIDDDDYRRGALTAHKKFGEAMAILAGDALHTLAFSTIARHQAAGPSALVQVIGLIADASGTAGMVGGQVDDIFYEGKEVDGATLRRIHSRKTGALLNASILSGAQLAGARVDEIAALGRFGEHIGLAFQIVDDILDVTGDDTKLGKQTGSDEKHEKATYPRVFGLEKSRELAQEATEAALDALSSLDSRSEPLRAFARYIVSREA